MMEQLLARVFGVAVGMLIVSIGVQAIRRGCLQPGKFDRMYMRADQPFTFWANVLFIIVFGVAISAWALWL